MGWDGGSWECRGGDKAKSCTHTCVGGMVMFQLKYVQAAVEDQGEVRMSAADRP